MVLEFTDLRTKKKFETNDFVLKVAKNGTRFAQAVAPSGAKSTRFVAKDFRK